jgi:acetyl-CoA carboxylase biotin carboxylase subunit
MIRRLLIANRGEIAVRIVHACRELGIESVAAYSDADRRARHVATADRAVHIGPAAAAESYLSIPRILDAVRTSGADAVHPGYGFLAENPALAAACEEAGIVFVGPPSDVIARMGSKIDSRRLMESSGVSIVPGETPTDQSDAGVQRAVTRTGLPAIVKASAGGGGRGLRRVTEAEEVLPAIQAARREAVAAFGDGTLYVERAIARPHHVEVQVFADDHGHAVHLFERECSVQRRHQKVLEESPSPAISRAMRTQMTEAAVRAARACRYRNAGTVEFLVDRSGGAGLERFYFLEMNTRLQVEHPVTEQVTGLDLVRAQLLVASGEPLPWTASAIRTHGHAIEARIYAEDPAADFLPQAGRILLYREPRLPGVRIDSAIAEGDEVSTHYDSMLAKVIASGETRAVAIARLASALRQYAILGVRTNVPFLLRILEHPRFAAGAVDTGFLDGEGASLVQTPLEELPRFVAAAVRAYDDSLAAPGGQARAPHGGPTARAAWDPWWTLRRWRT